MRFSYDGWQGAGILGGSQRKWASRLERKRYNGLYLKT